MVPDASIVQVRNISGEEIAGKLASINNLAPEDLQGLLIDVYLNLVRGSEKLFGGSSSLPLPEIPAAPSADAALR
jgi:hypothetical protein